MSCFIKIQIGLTFMVLAYPGCPGKEAVKRVSVCLQANDHMTNVSVGTRQLPRQEATTLPSAVCL